ncbi:MAG TPA: biotin/lipoyl-binding protein, partial [Steroidobacteraceae bacterium]|nr:biotin/lipoyl-binding protein [Steroidobacteraceae bacterium]
MGANPEPKPNPDEHPGEPIRWISRDAIPLDRVTVREEPSQGTDDGQGERRTKWIAGTALLIIALAAGAAYWEMRASSAAPTSLASRDSIPLITVVVPALKPVTTDVTFTGTIAARYDMPIGIDGDAGRIVAVKAEAGDHVRKGQVLAQLDTSVLEPQVNRLAA